MACKSHQSISLQTLSQRPLSQPSNMVNLHEWHHHLITTHSLICHKIKDIWYTPLSMNQPRQAFETQLGQYIVLLSDGAAHCANTNKQNLGKNNKNNKKMNKPFHSRRHKLQSCHPLLSGWKFEEAFWRSQTRTCTCSAHEHDAKHH